MIEKEEIVREGYDKKTKVSMEHDIFKAALADFKKNFLRRLNRRGLTIYGRGAPEDIGEHMHNAHLCYLHGIFITSILMASTGMENALRVSYKEQTGRNYEGSFKELTEWAERNPIIANGQAQKIDKVRKKIRNEIVHIKPFSEDDVNRIYELQERKFEMLTDEERKMIALYHLRTNPTEGLAGKVLEIADEIVEHLFPSIGRLPFPESGK